MNDAFPSWRFSLCLPDGMSWQYGYPFILSLSLSFFFSSTSWYSRDGWESIFRMAAVFLVRNIMKKAAMKIVPRTKWLRRYTVLRQITEIHTKYQKLNAISRRR
ncbi:hypothetical protein PUN28_004122 [Cardiocondyla obscurior]|uniref:Uncharacterized protein n=1 Tax=Cardiocondyla obscurior TaxID=286306 RepID=A0AAW2GPQ4_9HYME